MKKLRSKKGSAMVEAVMIFPLVIAGVMAVIYIVVGLYSSLSLQCSLHLALRKECGTLSQTVTRIEEIREFQSKKDWSGIRPVLEMEEEQEYRINTLFHMRVTRREEGRAYIIDEAEMIRLLDFREEET